MIFPESLWMAGTKIPCSLHYPGKFTQPALAFLTMRQLYPQPKGAVDRTSIASDLSLVDRRISLEEDWDFRFFSIKPNSRDSISSFFGTPPARQKSRLFRRNWAALDPTCHLEYNLRALSG